MGFCEGTYSLLANSKGITSVWGFPIYTHTHTHTLNRLHRQSFAPFLGPFCNIRKGHRWLKLDSLGKLRRSLHPPKRGSKKQLLVENPCNPPIQRAYSPCGTRCKQTTRLLSSSTVLGKRVRICINCHNSQTNQTKQTGREPAWSSLPEFVSPFAATRLHVPKLQGAEGALISFSRASWHSLRGGEPPGKRKTLQAKHGANEANDRNKQPCG